MTKTQIKRKAVVTSKNIKSKFGQGIESKVGKEKGKAGRLAIPLAELRKTDVAIVGGKSASLGEMIGLLAQKGVPVPGGFSTTALAYKDFLAENNLYTKIHDLLDKTNTHNSAALAKAGKQIRAWVMTGKFSPAFIAEVKRELDVLIASGVKSLAVRSSATAEDLPDASFAGQQETILNVPAKLEPVLLATKQVIASLFGDRAIAYREEQGFDHSLVSLCACVQQMVRSDKAVAGVMFSVDSESGHTGVIGITAVWGLGELAVGGANTDEYIVGKPTGKTNRLPVLLRRLGNQSEKLIFTDGKAKNGHFTKLVPTTPAERARFCLTTEQIEELGRFALTIENHYGCAMDMEWALDGITKKLYIVQARPVTVNHEDGSYIETYIMGAGERTTIVSGLAVGRRIATGTVRILKNSSPTELAKVKKGDIIVARMTDPNYVPAMRLASAIVTEEGSSKCHAAIIARELKKVAIVACPDALTKLKEGQTITVSCAEGSTGHAYKGTIPFTVKKDKIDNLPDLSVQLKMNVGDPGQALQVAMIKNKGVGLAREEFIVSNVIGIHPQACLDYKTLSASLKKEIAARTVGYKDPAEFYVQKLAEGIALITRAFYPNRVVLRLSDFKTNEYKDLIGGSLYEMTEANPMIGFRGAARYLDPKFQKCFEMECRALKIVREEMGLTNFDIMVPFVRTVEEGQKVKDLLAKNGLKSSEGKDGLRIGMMCEVPSNVTMAAEFAGFFDFASIGSNDLTQLTLGADRDSGCDFGDERNLAVKREIERAIKAWQKAGKPIGICGQAPSDYPGYAEWLAELGITSMSLNPDSVIPVWRRLAEAKKKP